MTIKISFKYWRTPFYSCRSNQKKGTPKNLFEYKRGEGYWHCNSEINPRGGKTVCIISQDNTTIAKGEVYCSMSDNFSYKIGRKMAFERALECIPDNFLAEVIYIDQGGCMWYAEYKAQQIIEARKKALDETK